MRTEHDMIKPGGVVALTKCPATTAEDGDEVVISGLYTLEEHHPYEPSAYCYESYWCVCPANMPEDTDPDEVTKHTYFVTDEHMYSQADPEGYGRSLVLEREMMFAEERQDMDYRFGTSVTKAFRQMRR